MAPKLYFVVFAKVNKDFSVLQLSRCCKYNVWDDAFDLL